MVKKDDYRSQFVDHITMFAQETKYNLIIQTSGDTIMGNPVNFDDDDMVSPTIDALLNTFAKSREKVIEEIQNDPDQQLSVRSIFLKDVTIIKSHPIKLPFLVVFVEEISAISLGNLDED